MKKKLLIGLLIVSLAINLFLLGDWLLFQPTEEEEIALSEMVQKTVERPITKGLQLGKLLLRSTHG